MSAAPWKPAKIVPLFEMPPANSGALSTRIGTPEAKTAPAEPTAIPPETTPLLTRMPAQKATELNAMIVPLLTIAPLTVLSAKTPMPMSPAEMSLLLRKPPDWNVLLVTMTLPAPIVPALVTPPLKVVALISISDAVPLNLVGYGPVNAMEPPSAPQAIDRLYR